MVSKRIRNAAKVALGIFSSRLLGVVRDILAFAFMGAGMVSSAFIFGFTLPNLMRRLFGEGALTSAFVPVYTEMEAKDGEQQAWRFLNAVVTWVGIVVLGVVVAFSGVLAWVYWGEMGGERWVLGAQMGIYMMPYLLLIALTALLTAVMTVKGEFWLSSLSQVWLNIILIVGVIWSGVVLERSALGIAYGQCIAVLLGGLVQLGVPVWYLYCNGWRYRVTLSGCEAINELAKLLVPGLMGAAVLQVNMVVSRCLAFSVGNSAVAVLYLANRLVELPLALFAVASTTVLFPELVRKLVKDGYERAKEEYRGVEKEVIMVTLPAAVGLWILSLPIIEVLFEWGRFGSEDTEDVARILSIFALSLPAYACGTLATRALHAMKEMRLPYRIAGVVFVVNLVLSLILMQRYGAEGLAWANVVSAWVQLILLRKGLAQRLGRIGYYELLKLLVIIAVALSVMTGGVLGVSWVASHYTAGKVLAMVQVGLGVPAGVIIYFGVLYLLGAWKGGKYAQRGH